jgi:large subunit ribosomal protein L17
MPQRKLNKTAAHRKAMFSNMVTDFFRHERIETTLTKARELRPITEKLITTAKTNDLNSRRRVLRVVKDKTVVKKLFDEIAPRFVERPGGYTRILKMYPRLGDASEKAIIELVE